jgi:ketosteroid isomerase-like protein
MTGLTATASELASAFATALAAGDADAAVARCADDVAMVMMYPPPGADGVIRGRDAVREMFARPQRAMAGFAGTTPVVHDVVGGRLAIAELAVSGTVRATGRPYKNRLCFFVSVKDGKITEFREYFDSAAAREALGRPPAPD